MNKKNFLSLFISLLVILALAVSSVTAQGTLQSDAEREPRIFNGFCEAALYDWVEGDMVEIQVASESIVTEGSDEFEALMQNLPSLDLAIERFCCDGCDREIKMGFRFEDLGFEPGALDNVIMIEIPVDGDPILFFSIEEYEEYQAEINSPQVIPFSSRPSWCPGGRILTTTTLFSETFSRIGTFYAPPNRIHIYECHTHRYRSVDTCTGCGTQIGSNQFTVSGCGRHTTFTEPIPPPRPPDTWIR